MENKKVKVKLVTGFKRYKVIEVEEHEVEKIRAVNRLTWAEIKREMRRKERFEKEGIVFTSLDEMEEECETIADTSTIDPLSQLAKEEERKEKNERLYAAMEHLTERQKQFVKLIYFEDKSQDEVALQFGVSKSAISHAMERIYATLKKFFEEN